MSLVFADDMTLYTEKPKDSKKLLELVNEFSKVARYKMNIWTSVAFYMPIMNYQKGKLRKRCHKIPRNNSNLGCKRPMLGNYKTLKKDIKKDTNK